MADFLLQMAKSSEARVAQASAERDLARLARLIESTATAPPLDLGHTFSVIAEIKGHSPAEGALADHESLDRCGLAKTYADAGAAAVSVLSEPSRFAGELDHVAEVASALAPKAVGVMRKDFLVSPYQIYEARLAGAGGVLLITAMLSDAMLIEMLATAANLSLFVLLECFDREDIRRSVALLDHPDVVRLRDNGQFMLGVNTRNLRTLEVDSDRLETLAPLLPGDVITVAESGIRSPEDVAGLVALGYGAALIGTALMRSDDPGALIRAMRAAVV